MSTMVYCKFIVGHLIKLFNKSLALVIFIEPESIIVTNLTLSIIFFAFANALLKETEKMLLIVFTKTLNIKLNFIKI